MRPAPPSPPDYVRLTHDELHRLFLVERDTLAGYVFLLLLQLADPKSGEVVTTHTKLIAFCTPPRPERGQPRRGPTLNQLRRVLTLLETAGLLTRDSAHNLTQQQLRLCVPPRR